MGLCCPRQNAVHITAGQIMVARYPGKRMRATRIGGLQTSTVDSDRAFDMGGTSVVHDSASETVQIYTKNREFMYVRVEDDVVTVFVGNDAGLDDTARAALEIGLRDEDPLANAVDEGADLPGQTHVCPICMTRSRRLSFKCGHALCATCTRALMRDPRALCPTCRTPIEEIRRLML